MSLYLIIELFSFSVIQIPTIRKSDWLGVTASGLCIIHCIATPFLFVAQSSSVAFFNEKPFWWGAIDYVFILVTLLAVFSSSRHTAKRWMKIGLYSVWSLLTILILNEKFEVLHIGELATYVMTSILIVLHLYNQKYCLC